MDGLIILIILIPLVYLILLLVILGKSTSQQQSLDSIKNLLNQVREQVKGLDLRVKELQNEELQNTPELKNEPVQEIVRPAVKIPPVVIKEETPAVKIEVPVSPVIHKEEVVTKKIPDPVEASPVSSFTAEKEQVAKTDLGLWT